MVGVCDAMKQDMNFGKRHFHNWTFKVSGQFWLKKWGTSISTWKHSGSYEAVSSDEEHNGPHVRLQTTQRQTD